MDQTKLDQTVPTQDKAPEIVVDLSSWRMKDYVKWQKIVATGEFAAMNEVMATIIKSWPYAGDPTNLDSFGELTAAEWKGAAQAIGSASAAAFR